MPGFARVAFGPFVLDGDSRELLRGPELASVDLGPKATDLLLLLVAERHRVLPKHTLRERIWPDAHVALETLYSLLKELRRALGDSGRHPQYVKNIKSVGYRFIAEVREVERGQCPVRCWLVSTTIRDEPLRDGEHILGRLLPSTLLLAAPEVSRRHAKIVVDGEGARLADLHSKNKTFVNGQEIDPDAAPRPLVDGDEIRIGRFLFVFRAIEGTTATAIAREEAQPEQ
jgi:DNA-binding winged helix-turn-helix (wHTH) protein